MAEDQRFASARPDVLTYKTDILTDTLTFIGPITANLYVASTSTDYDIVVKIIDLYPDTVKKAIFDEAFTERAGYQQMVRTEIFRAKYRESYEFPEAIIPGKIIPIEIRMNDIAHSFLPGHCIMVQIQSSMFPLYDRNPQVFTNIYEADQGDFQNASISIYRSVNYPSSVQFETIKQ
jgi:putative CocE/NonD family hydrolase